MLNLNLDVDEIWRSLGQWGSYQRFQIFIIFMDGMACSFHLLSTVVIGFRYPYFCRETELNCSDIDQHCNSNDSLYIEYDKCSMNIYRNDSNLTLLTTQGCVNGFSYPVPKDRTFVTEWDLVCQNAGFAEFTQTLVIVGQATGAAIFTQFSDRFGRKPVHVVAHVGIFGLAMAMAFVPNFTAFAVLRYLVGTFQQGMIMTNTVMALETLPRESRFIGHIFTWFSWTTGIVLLAPLGYFFRNTSWRYLQMTLALYSAYSLSLYWIFEESLRWLIANGKSKEAERIIRKAARWNKVKYEDVISRARKAAESTDLLSKTTEDPSGPDNNLKHDHDGITLDTLLTAKDIVPLELNVQSTDASDACADTTEIKQDTENQARVKRYTFLTILKTRKILINSLILWYIWIVDSLTYYGIALFSYSLSGNRFLNFFLTAIMDYPAHITEVLLMNRIGRKKTVMFFHLVTGVSCIAATVFMTLSNGNASMLAASTAFTLIGKYGTAGSFGNGNASMLAASTTFTLIGKYGTAGSFGSIFLYTPELYPTNLRNVGLGVSSTISRIGGMLAPFAGPLAERIQWAPGAIFGSMCLLVTLLCIRLPETTKFELPQTLEEMEKWSKANKNNKKKNKNSSTDKTI